MNKKRIAQYCCAALVAAGIGLNIQNAIADYGIGENSLSLVADPGSNSGSNSNSNWNSNTDTWPDMSDSDSNGDEVIERKFKLVPEPCVYRIKGTPGQWIHWSIGDESGTIQIDETGYGLVPHEESHLICVHDQELGDLTQEQCVWGRTECPDININ